MFEKMLDREAARNLFREECKQVCTKHNYPPKDIETKEVERIGMAFMILDKLESIEAQLKR